MIEGVDLGLPALPSWEPEWRTQMRRHCRWGVRDCASWTLLEHANGKLSARDVERIVKEAKRMLDDVDGDLVGLVPVMGECCFAAWSEAEALARQRSPYLTAPMTARLQRALYTFGPKDVFNVIVLEHPVRWLVAWDGPCPPPLAMLGA